MMTLIQEEYFVGKHFDQVNWFVHLYFISDFLQVIPMNTHSDPTQMRKNAINI